MSLAELADLPELGVGIAHTAELAQRLGDRLSELVVRVEPHTSWRQLGDDEYAVPEDELHALRSYVGATLVHATRDPVGGTIAASSGVADAFVRSVDALRPAWVSAQLGFASFLADEGVRATGQPLPMVQTERAAEIAVERIAALANRVGRPVAFETSASYLRAQPWELPDGELAAVVAEEADCGIVLDLHALYTNAVNKRQALDEFVATLPLARVIEVHVAGGRSHGSFWMDAHCGATPIELRALAELVVPRLPNLKAIVFELQGRYHDRLDEAALADELEWMQLLWAMRGRDAIAPVRRRWTPIVHRDVPTPAAWETTLGELVRGRMPAGALARTLAADPGIEIHRDVVSRARRLAIGGALPWTLGALRMCAGGEVTRALIEQLLDGTSPALLDSVEALRFADALGDVALDPLVRDTLALECAGLRARIEGVPHRVRVEHEPRQLFAAIAEGQRPSRIAPLEVELSP
jgi:uncharacterized protein (UPF0276 family)